MWLAPGQRDVYPSLCRVIPEISFLNYCAFCNCLSYKICLWVVSLGSFLLNLDSFFLSVCFCSVGHIRLWRSRHMSVLLYVHQTLWSAGRQRWAVWSVLQSRRWVLLRLFSHDIPTLYFYSWTQLDKLCIFTHTASCVPVLLDLSRLTEHAALSHKTEIYLWW